MFFERCAYLKRNLIRGPAGPTAFTLPTEFKFVGPPHSSLRPFITQSLLGWQEGNVSVLPAEAQDPASDNRMQEGTQKQNLFSWKGGDSSLREKLSHLETKKEVHVHRQGEPEDQRASQKRKNIHEDGEKVQVTQCFSV